MLIAFHTFITRTRISACLRSLTISKTNRMKTSRSKVNYQSMLSIKCLLSSTLPSERPWVTSSKLTYEKSQRCCSKIQKVASIQSPICKTFHLSRPSLSSSSLESRLLSRKCSNRLNKVIRTSFASKNSYRISCRELWEPKLRIKAIQCNRLMPLKGKLRLL